jgi:hypothetical protein
LCFQTSTVQRREDAPGILGFREVLAERERPPQFLPGHIRILGTVVGQTQVVVRVRVAGKPLHARLELGQRQTGLPLLVVDPPECIGHLGIVRQRLPGRERERQRLVKVSTMFHV